MRRILTFGQFLAWGLASTFLPIANAYGSSAARPEVTWSVMHPVVVEPSYMQRVVDKAVEYGGVDSFEICGECNQPHGGLNGLLAYEPYPKTAAAVDRAAVETYRRKLRETVEIAHRAGKGVYFWHREGFMPKTMHEDLPGLLDEDGEYDLLGKPYLDYVRWKVREAFRQVPALDGVVLTLTEADFSVIHNSRPDRYPPTKVVETITRIFLEEHARLGKRLIFRSFGSIKSDYEDLIAGANACSGDYAFEIETKITPFDFSPFLPANPYLKKTSRCTVGAECDCLGEYLGAGYLPAVQVDAIARYVGYGRAANVDRYTIRIDRVGNSIFDSAQEVNLYAYMRFIRDGKATAEQVLDEWAKRRWPRCAEEMKTLAKKSFGLVEAVQFIDHNVCFHQNPPTPSFKFIKFSGILGVFRDGMDLHMTEPMWGMMSAQKTPGRAAIRSEKARAEKIAAEGLALLESLKERLDPDEYARQHRAWSIAAKAVPAMRAFWDAVAAYFDDMDAESADAPRLAAAVKAAEETIMPRMKSTEIDLSQFNLNACRARGEDLDKVYFATFLWLSRELRNEYRAEFAARAKLLARNDVIDFVVPGGIYDDVRVRRVMHSSYQTIEGGVPVRFVGNAAFPNGTIAVEFRDVAGARVEIDADPRYATDFSVSEKTEKGVRTVTISKKGASYPGIRSIALVKCGASPCAASGTHERLPAEPFSLAGATVGYDAPEAAEGAAFLAEKLSRILGAEVVTGATGRIVFERADFADAQQYEILTSPSCAKLRASGALGFTAAAADFLHAAGYRCFAPHAAWEVLPNPVPAAVTRGVRESPDYRTRAIFAWLWPEFRKDAFERTWRLANRIGGERVNTGHSYEAFIRENREFLKAHPECLALVGGVRKGPKLCVSNALLKDRFVEWSLARARKSPGALSVSVEPSDGGGWCKCADCAKIGSPTDQAVTLANAVAVALRRENLDVAAGLYAYNHHSPPPSVAVEPNVIVSVSTGFLTGGWTPEKLVAAWSEKARMIGIRDYLYSGPLPGERQNANSSQISRAVKAYHRLGARWMTASSTDGWVGGLVGFNLASRLLWNVDADPAQIRADLVARAFPTAGDAASEFLYLIDGASRRPACEDLFARLYEELDVAWRRVQTPAADEGERERVRELVAWTRFEEMLFAYYADPGEEKARAMLELAAALKPYRALPTYEWFRDGRPLGKPGKALANSFDWRSPRALPEPGATIAAGLAANKKLPFTPVEFSPDATLHADPGAKGAGSVGALRSAHSFYIWSDGRPFNVSVTGGLISRYRNRGNVSLSLWQIGGVSDTGELETEVWKDASVPPDGTNRVVCAVPRNPGLHRLDVYDGGDQTRYGFPTNLPVAIYVKQARSPELRGDYFFHVPAGTRSLGFYAKAWTGQLCSPDGKAVRNIRKLRGHYTVEVPEGMDGKTWSVRGLRGVVQPLTAPPWLNLNPRLMLYPNCPGNK